MSINSRLQFFSKIFKRSSDLETYIQKAFGKREEYVYFLTPTWKDGTKLQYFVSNDGRNSVQAFTDAFQNAPEGKVVSFPLYEYVSGDPLDGVCPGTIKNTVVKKSNKSLLYKRKEFGQGYVFYGSIEGVSSTEEDVIFKPSTSEGTFVYGIKVYNATDVIPSSDVERQDYPTPPAPYTTERYEREIELVAANTEFTNPNLKTRYDHVDKVFHGDLDEKVGYRTGESNWFIEKSGLAPVVPAKPFCLEGGDTFTTLDLYLGENVEVSNDAITWIPYPSVKDGFAWNDESEHLIEGRAFSEDRYISGQHYYAWWNEGAGEVDYYYTTTDDLKTEGGDQVWSIDGTTVTEAWVTRGAVTADVMKATVSNGKIYVRAKTGSSPLCGFLGNYTKVSGNIMTLIDYDNWSTAVISEGQFVHPDGDYGLFTFEGLGGTLEDASELELPATTLANNCYASMFAGQESLTGAPTLPATNLALQCYGGMFQGCTTLTVAPDLPATTLADGCYIGMFANCESLVTAPSLPALTTTEQCYLNMFTGCTSLTQAPELPATNLATGCYINMFQNCFKLTGPIIIRVESDDPTTATTNNMFTGAGTSRPSTPTDYNKVKVASHVSTWTKSKRTGIDSTYWTVEQL